MKKTVDEFMELPYAIEITPDDGSYFVKVKELEGCMSVGDTKAEALEMIDDAMRGWLEVALEDGIEIPLPEALREDKYSGKFALRMTKSLHRKLAEGAEQEGVSINQYIVNLLTENNAKQEILRLLRKQIAMASPPEDEFADPIVEIRAVNPKVVSLFDRRPVRLAGAL
jgi:antitoxin HicB